MLLRHLTFDPMRMYSFFNLAQSPGLISGIYRVLRPSETGKWEAANVVRRTFHNTETLVGVEQTVSFYEL